MTIVSFLRLYIFITIVGIGSFEHIIWIRFRVDVRKLDAMR